VGKAASRIGGGFFVAIVDSFLKIVIGEKNENQGKTHSGE
jgi:hypothetical protein